MAPYLPPTLHLFEMIPLPPTYPPSLQDGCRTLHVFVFEMVPPTSHSLAICLRWFPCLALTLHLFEMVLLPSLTIHLF